jgi:CRP-like cAMP-binding protein
VDIAQGRLFAGLPAEARAAILAGAAPRLLTARQMLAPQGAPATTFYVVQVGHLKLSQFSPDGREIIARFAGPGDPYGGIVALGQPTYPVSAMAVEPARVLAWPAAEVQRLTAAYPQWRANIVQEIARHMTDALDRVQELSNERVSQRLARTLLRLGAHGIPRSGSAVEIAHPITRQDLADLTSTTLFTVSRLLSRWEELGLIASTRGHVSILDSAGLRQKIDVPEDE